MIDRLAKIPLPWGEGIKSRSALHKLGNTGCHTAAGRGMQVIILKLVITLTPSLSHQGRGWFCDLLTQASKFFHINRLPIFSSERVHYKNGPGAKEQSHIRVRDGFHPRAMLAEV